MLSVEVACLNCKKSVMPEKTVVSACRHVICIDCVNAAQPLVPSPFCFCCPYEQKSWNRLTFKDVPVFL
jgi:hypothetical protein